MKGEMGFPLPDLGPLQWNGSIYHTPLRGMAAKMWLQNLIRNLHLPIICGHKRVEASIMKGFETIFKNQDVRQMMK